MQITPSTVFAPTDTPMNVGFYLNQQWVRYEPYLNLTAVNSPATNYPGDHTTAFGGTNNTSAAPSIATFYRGYVDGVSGAPTNTAVAPPTNVYRDSWTSPADNPVVGGRQGQPIRIQGSGFAGWADVKADLGGFVFQSYVANSNGYYYPALELTRLRTLAYANSYNLIAAGNANGANPLELEQFSAWKGNRDGAPAFGSMVGTPAYYDVTVGSCNPSTGPAVANQCIAYGSGSVGVVSRNCSVGGTALQERDASTAIRFTGGTCADSGPPTCTIDGVSQPLASCTSAGITPPTCALQTQDTFFSRFYESNCGFSGQSTVAVATCQWTGRQSVLIKARAPTFTAAPARKAALRQVAMQGARRDP